MTLKNLGFTEAMAAYQQANGLEAFTAGRITAEHRERYLVRNEQGEFEAELLGNLRFSAQHKTDLPAVGDWVTMSPYDEGKALIHAVFPRYSKLERQAVGKFGEKQLIATNLDYALVVQAVNRDFNLNRLERYLTLCHAAKITPLIVLSKIDLAEAETWQQLQADIQARIEHTPVLPVSNETQQGIAALQAWLHPGKTYCLLGSSGVGKSSLINSLSGEARVKTGAISEAIDRGKHVTTHRELIPLMNGALLIDNPGMREVGLTDSPGGLEHTFERIYELAQTCKFSDCTHTTETGCAVLQAVDAGEIEASALENYHKMESEQAYFASSVQERRHQDRQRGKVYREAKKFRKDWKG